MFILLFALKASDLFIGYIGASIGEALVSGANVAIIFDSLKELKKEDFFSKFNARAGLIARTAITLAIFLGGYLYQLWIGLPYALQGLSYILTSVIIFLMVEPRIDTEKFSLKSYLNQTKEGFREIFKNNYMRKLTVFYSFVGGITWACVYYFQLAFAKDLGFTETEISWVFGFIYLSMSLILLWLVETKGLLTRNRVYLGFPIIMSISLLPGLIASKFTGSLMILGLSLAASARFAILDNYANKEFLSKYRATAISALNMLVSLFFIIVVGIGGKIQDLYSTKLIFTLLGVLTIFLVFPSGLSLVKEYKEYKLRNQSG